MDLSYYTLKYKEYAEEIVKASEKINIPKQKDLEIKKNPKNMISFFSSHRKKLSIDLHFQANENIKSIHRLFQLIRCL